MASLQFNKYSSTYLIEALLFSSESRFCKLKPQKSRLLFELGSWRLTVFLSPVNLTTMMGRRFTIIRWQFRHGVYIRRVYWQFKHRAFWQFYPIWNCGEMNLALLSSLLFTPTEANQGYYSNSKENPHADTGFSNRTKTRRLGAATIRCTGS
jgi:hypothetical protein